MGPFTTMSCSFDFLQIFTDLLFTLYIRISGKNVQPKKEKNTQFQNSALEFLKPASLK